MEWRAYERQMCDVGIYIVRYFSMTESFSSSIAFFFVAFNKYKLFLIPELNIQNTLKISKQIFFVWCNDHRGLRGNVSNDSQFEYFLLEGKQSHIATEEETLKENIYFEKYHQDLYNAIESLPPFVRFTLSNVSQENERTDELLNESLELNVSLIETKQYEYASFLLLSISVTFVWFLIDF